MIVRQAISLAEANGFLSTILNGYFSAYENIIQQQPATLIMAYTKHLSVQYFTHESWAFIKVFFWKR